MMENRTPDLLAPASPALLKPALISIPMGYNPIGIEVNYSEYTGTNIEEFYAKDKEQQLFSDLICELETDLDLTAKLCDMNENGNAAFDFYQGVESVQPIISHN